MRDLRVVFRSAKSAKPRDFAERNTTRIFRYFAERNTTGIFRYFAERNTTLFLCVVVGVAMHAPAGAEDPVERVAGFDSIVQPFLDSYCVKCHGAKSQKGDRRFDELDGTIADDNTLLDYQDILDLLNLGEMPPEEAKQPTDHARRDVIESLTGSIRAFHQSRSNRASTVLRRLNGREYRNTVRDLLDLDVTAFDPASAFPRDQTSQHLDNVGEALVTSGHLLARYLEAAEQVVEKAITPIEKPEVQTWSFRDGFHQQPEIDQVHRKTNGYSHMTLYDVVGADKPEGAYGPIHAFADGVPVDGVYELRIRAEAVNRINPYDPEFLGTDPNEPLRLGIVPGDRTVGNLHLPQPNEPLLAEIDLADEPKWYTVRIWLDRGITPRFTFRNGLMDARNLWTRLIKKYRDQFPKDVSSGIVSMRYNAIKHGKLPQIHIDEIEIKGPIYDDWPTASHRDVLGDDWQLATTGQLDEGAMRTHLRRFMTRAYRGPVTDGDVDRVMNVIAQRKEAGRTTLQAYSDGLKTVLCSPKFLYLNPDIQDESAEASDAQPSSGTVAAADENPGRLSPVALASRLSYFLWASMPDDELFQLAASGELERPEVLPAQVDRMLESKKSDALVDGFLASWLTLRDLGSMPPDRGDFPDYYHYDLDTAMRRETHLFTRHLIDENLDVGNFLDSDFTFVNKRLGKMYGIEIEGGGFQRVSISDPRRGGLLGQASVLTVTANGIDTSPVVRGVWLLENILGTPPSPPPPDVEPLDPDTRGAKTIRDQLAKHRTIASCNDCHQKIDPIGFALENFDAIGQWRDKYARDAAIDASGQLPGGKSFEDIVGFKRVLVEKKELFTRALTEKMLAYAIGRHVQPSDRPAVEQILVALEDKGHGMRDLVQLIVQSEPFRSP
jgi:hypothetical protein